MRDKQRVEISGWLLLLALIGAKSFLWMKFYTQPVHIHWGSHRVVDNKIPIKCSEFAQEPKCLKIQWREASQSLSHRENLTEAFQHMNQNYIVEFILWVGAIEALSISYGSFLLVNNCGEVTKAISFQKKFAISLLSHKSYQAQMIKKFIGSSKLFFCVPCELMDDLMWHFRIFISKLSFHGYLFYLSKKKRYLKLYCDYKI